MKYFPSVMKFMPNPADIAKYNFSCHLHFSRRESQNLGVFVVLAVSEAELIMEPTC